MNITMKHPGGHCIDEILRLKEKIKNGEYKLPIHLIVVKEKGADAITLNTLEQIDILNLKYNNLNPCGEKECSIVKLLNDKGESIIVNPHEYCSLKVSPDARGKPIFLSIDDEINNN